MFSRGLLLTKLALRDRRDSSLRKLAVLFLGVPVLERNDGLIAIFLCRGDSPAEDLVAGDAVSGEAAPASGGGWGRSGVVGRGGFDVAASFFAGGVGGGEGDGGGMLVPAVRDTLGSFIAGIWYL
jgi:hypothetical protein